MVKNTPVHARDTGNMGSISEVKRSLGGNGNLPVFLPGKSQGQRGAWQASVHGVTELDMTEHTCMQCI